MCNIGLLTTDHKSVICSGHTVHHRNWLLLECVRHLELQFLLEFCKLVKKDWEEIGLQLITGMYEVLVCINQFMYMYMNTYVCSKYYI